MGSLTAKQIGVIVLAAILVAAGIFLLFGREEPEAVPERNLEEGEIAVPIRAVIGKSVEGRDIESYTYGEGDIHLLFVGGIHGGYEWNSVLLAYEFVDYLDAHPELVPGGVAVTIVPSANPDGVYETVRREGRFSASDIPSNDSNASGRFNANGVDLNRNFDCKWKSESTWRGNRVSAGTEAFSEPEARAIRDFVLERDVDAAVFWHSQSNAVYASECEEGVLPETIEVMNAYADAAGYPAVESFDFYEITGDAEGWLASIGIPAITVELATHETVEWDRNLKGMEALLEYYK